MELASYLILEIGRNASRILDAVGSYGGEAVDSVIEHHAEEIKALVGIIGQHIMNGGH